MNWQEYEIEKAKIQALNLSPEEYQKVIEELAYSLELREELETENE